MVSYCALLLVVSYSGPILVVSYCVDSSSYHVCWGQEQDPLRISVDYGKIGHCPLTFLFSFCTSQIIHKIIKVRNKPELTQRTQGEEAAKLKICF